MSLSERIAFCGGGQAVAHHGAWRPLAMAACPAPDIKKRSPAGKNSSSSAVFGDYAY
jgi:hypothetical protein